jgi:hypothetical protein
MRTIFLASALAAAVAAMGLACGCSTTPPLVVNPAYQMWADFEPGSWAMSEGTRKAGDQVEKIQIFQRLAERTPDRVVLERTVKASPAATSQPAGPVKAAPATQPVVTRLVEPKMIKPTEHLQTRPEAVTKELPAETIVVKGLTLSCRVIDVEVHVTFGGLLPTCEDSYMRRWLSQAVPGGTVRITLDRYSTSHSLEVSTQLVDYKVVRRAQP